MPIDLIQTSLLHESRQQALEERFTVHKSLSPDDPELLASVGPRVRAVIGGTATPAFMDALPALEIIAAPGVGYDGIDIEAARARGIRVTNTPDVLNDAVAELTVGLMLAHARRLPFWDRFSREGRWLSEDRPLTRQLAGSRAGILGLGRIGKEIANRLVAMKVEIGYFGRNRQDDQPYRYFSDLAEMARASDWLVVVAPGGPSTNGIVSRAVLEALGPEGVFVNVARGSLVDEPALIELLETGRLGGAALDVFADEPDIDPRLMARDDVVLAPHIGSGTHPTRQAMADLVLANLDAHFAGRPLVTPVI